MGAELYLPKRLPLCGVITLERIEALVCVVVPFMVKRCPTTMLYAIARVLSLRVLAAKV